MGLDFIRRHAKTFEKAWHNDRQELARPTLFTRHPECHSRSVVAELYADAHVAVGDDVIVGVQDGTLTITVGLLQIGLVVHPPQDLLGSIRAAGGLALGHISRLHPISGTADVEIE